MVNLITETGVPVANILLSFNRDEIIPILNQTSVDQLFSSFDITKKENFVFNSKNDQFLSFVHEFGESDSGAQSTVTIEFIDPENKFEQRMISLISNSLNSRKERLKQDKQQRQSYIEKLQEEIDVKEEPSLAKEVLKLAAKETLSNEVRLAGEGFVGGGQEPVSNAKAQVANSILNDIEEELKDLQDSLGKFEKLDEEILRNTALEAWVMYGTGTSLDAWSRPVFCHLTRARYDYNARGVRKITLQFVSNFTPYEKSIEGQGVGTKVEAPHRWMVTKNERITVGYTDAMLDSFNIIQPNEIRLSDGSYTDAKAQDGFDLFGEVDIVVATAIRKYLQAATNQDNVLIFLPSIDKCCGSWIDLKRESLANRLFGKFVPPSTLELRTKQDFFEALGFVTEEGKLEHVLSPEALQAYNSLTTREKAKVSRIDHSISLVSEMSDTFLRPIKVLEENLSKLSDITLNIHSYWEHDPNVIALFYKYFPNYVPDPGKPVFIWGSKAFIERFLLARVYLEHYDLFPRLGHEEDAFIYDDKIPKRLEKAASNDYLTEIGKLKYERTLVNNFGALTYNIDGQDDIKKQLAAANIPVFKSGVKNSNILSVRFDMDDQYTAILQSLSLIVDESYVGDSTSVTNLNREQLLKIYDGLKGTTVLERIVDSNPTSDSTKQEIADLITQYAEIKFSVNEMDNISVSLFLLRLIQLGIEENSQVGIMIDPLFKDDPIVAILTLVQRLMSMSRLGEIETVPMFHLSHSIIPYPALVLLLEHKIVGSKGNNPINAAFSGWWDILGYRHTISQNKIASSFRVRQGFDTAKTPDAVQTITESEVKEYTEDFVLDYVDTNLGFLGVDISK